MFLPHKVGPETEYLHARCRAKRGSTKTDRGERALDKAKGRMKEAVGSVTGDEEKKDEGRSCWWASATASAVTALQTFAGRATQEREILEELKKTT